MSLLFACALFVGAFLLFWVQPLVGKALLPLLGGTPAVWNTCMLFFQALLLAGYAYAHALTRWLSSRAQGVLHGALLLGAALALPFAVGNGSGPPAGASPVLWLLKTLLLTAGPPFFVLSAGAPLLQKWYSRTRARDASDPYYLYAASNAGSLCALLGFPVLLEPRLTLGQQSRAWAVLYVALALLVIGCAAFALMRPRAATHDEKLEGGEAKVEGGAASDADAAGESERISLRRRLRWLVLAFVPSSLVLGVTTYVTTDLVAVPLLWVIPLSLYLLSFVIVFARRRIIPSWLSARLLPGAAVLVSLVYLSGAAQPAWFLILFHLLFLFTAALVCHGALADDRPGAAHLAEFYLWLAAGGALGGLFNAVLAPLLFNSIVEYPLVILLASYLRPAYKRARGALLGLRLGAKRNVERAAVGTSILKVRDDEPGGEAVRGAEGDARRETEEETAEGVEVAGGKRWDVFDLLVPLLLGMLTAALMLVTRSFDLNSVERAALTLGLPLFLLNHFTAPRPTRFALGLAAVMLATALFAEQDVRTLHASRNFYGTHRVESDDADTLHWLRHGSTLHGKQNTDPKTRCEPLSYYHREGPLGSVFKHVRAKRDATVGARPLSIAVVGLGAGTTAAYARAGEAWTFYEIDPQVLEVARDPRYFTYLSECAGAPINVVIGDARLRLRGAPDGAYDLIALDAFSSDAVPAHLMTREALQLYLSKLAPGGVIAFHVSNRSLQLERVAGGIAADAGLASRIFDDGRQGAQFGLDPSTWVAVARTDADFGTLASDTDWPEFEPAVYKLEVWRDDFSDILSVFRW
ncbi:MAG TPA: fused MFS/spermidine synthase [Pyrinomonadaceae bacterium]|nr:fused MFS/spermidine synthase [Pyrinomonadaceae bacterium]